MADATDTPNTPTAQRETAHDPHVAWKQRADALRARINTPSTSDEVQDILGVECDTLHDRIAATPARTAAGVIAQLEVVLHPLQRDGLSPEDLSPEEACQVAALRNAIAWLQRGGGA
jgi:hypothetical protein